MLLIFSSNRLLYCFLISVTFILSRRVVSEAAVTIYSFLPDLRWVRCWRQLHRRRFATPFPCYLYLCIYIYIYNIYLYLSIFLSIRSSIYLSIAPSLHFPQSCCLSHSVYPGSIFYFLLFIYKYISWAGVTYCSNKLNILNIGSARETVRTCDFLHRLGLGIFTANVFVFSVSYFIVAIVIDFYRIAHFSIKFGTLCYYIR